MTCFICKSEDKAVGVGGTFEDRTCPNCGHYGIQSALMEQIKALNQKLHIGRTREYLVMRLGSGEKPWITPVDINNYNLLDS